MSAVVLEDDWNVKVNTETIPWPSDSPIRRSSVSSFGYGGTNGHVVVEAANVLYPEYRHGKKRIDADYDHATTRPLLLCFSAHDKTTLDRNIAAIRKIASDYFPADLAFTLNTRRTRFSQRAYTMIREGKGIETLDETALSYGATGKKVPAVGYLFTGQGVRCLPSIILMIEDLTSSGTMGRYGRGGDENFPSFQADNSQAGSSPH